MVRVVRCRIVGIGSDMTAGTRKIRWMDATTLRKHLPWPYAHALMRALGAEQAARLSPLTDERAASTTTEVQLPVRPDRPRRMERAGDAMAVGLPVAGQEDGVDALEAV